MEEEHGVGLRGGGRGASAHAAGMGGGGGGRWEGEAAVVGVVCAGLAQRNRRGSQKSEGIRVWPGFI